MSCIVGRQQQQIPGSGYSVQLVGAGLRHQSVMQVGTGDAGTCAWADPVTGTGNFTMTNGVFLVILTSAATTPITASGAGLTISYLDLTAFDPVAAQYIRLALVYGTGTLTADAGCLAGFHWGAENSCALPVGVIETNDFRTVHLTITGAHPNDSFTEAYGPYLAGGDRIILFLETTTDTGNGVPAGESDAGSGGDITYNAGFKFRGFKHVSSTGFTYDISNVWSGVNPDESADYHMAVIVAKGN